MFLFTSIDSSGSQGAQSLFGAGAARASSGGSSQAGSQAASQATSRSAGSADVTDAIRQAANASGVSFDYLLGTAQRESSLNPQARSGSSSATGLYQFIDSTWLQMVKEAGPGMGLGDYAAGIQRSASGAYVAQDASTKQSVLALRQDPATSAMVAAAFTQRNQQALETRLGREPSDGELYIAHLMGAGGAAQLIGQAASDPSASAVSAFPAQAAANTTIFHDSQGGARSVGEVYAALTKTPGPAAVTRTAASPSGDSASIGQSLPDAATSGPAAWLSSVPDTSAAWTSAASTSAASTSAASPFTGLFRTDATAPLSNAVMQGWSRLGTDVKAADAAAAIQAIAPAAPVSTASETSAASPAIAAPIVTAAAAVPQTLLQSVGSFMSGLFARPVTSTAG